MVHMECGLSVPFKSKSYANRMKHQLADLIEFFINHSLDKKHKRDILVPSTAAVRPWKTKYLNYTSGL